LITRGYVKKVVSVIIALNLVACAGAGVRPIVDMQSKTSQQYENDLQQCQSYATQQAGAISSGAVAAGAGAVLGGLLGLVAGGNRTGIAQTAGIGGVLGGAGGLFEGNKAQEQVVKQCLRGRGYNVLN
jgi:hypothetical protein